MATKNQTTELVFINSSRPRTLGPKAKVTNRRKDYYMLPRSPISPTLFRRTQVPAISGSLASRLKSDYILTKVSELDKVEPFAIDPQNLSAREPSSVPSMNLTKAPVFSPSEDHTSDFFQLRSLDMLPAEGLSEGEFWGLFSRCAICKNFMTTRTIPYHRCPIPSDSQSSKSDKKAVENSYFLWLLDVHNPSQAAGVTEDVFREIFYTCVECGRYMTQRLSFNHHDIFDDWDFSDSGPSLCTYLRAKVENEGPVSAIPDQFSLGKTLWGLNSNDD